MSHPEAELHFQKLSKTLSGFSDWTIFTAQQAQEWSKRMKEDHDRLSSIILKDQRELERTLSPVDSTMEINSPTYNYEKPATIPPPLGFQKQTTNAQPVQLSRVVNPNYKTGRAVFFPWQIDILEGQYKTNPYIDQATRTKLAHMTALTEMSIKNWFQNKRSRDRISSNKSSPVALGNYRPLSVDSVSNMNNGLSTIPYSANPGDARNGVTNVGISSVMSKDRE